MGEGGDGESGGSGGTGDWEIRSMAVAGAGPPSTRKGYAAVSGKAANGGRRAAVLRVFNR